MWHNINKDLFIYIKRNWKIFLHLFFRTKRFGVNNKWWSDFNSPFGISIWKRLWWAITVKPLINNYQMIIFRARGCWFLTTEELNLLGWLNYYDTN